eukprot:Colp12_sorted_trinity150504_noHs@28252
MRLPYVALHFCLGLSTARAICHPYSQLPQRSCATMASSGLTVNGLTNVLKAFAPLDLAESWDNVGLLVEPSGDPKVEKLFLTNDLTEETFKEALDEGANYILSYHPPIFSAFKRLTQRTAKERIIIGAIENKIAVYSPHTTYDALNGGVTDWLASGAGKGKIVPVTTTRKLPSTEQVKIVTFVPHDALEKVHKALSAIPAVGVIGDYSHCSYRIEGTGSFLGNEKTNPTVGKSGVLETAPEVRLEMVASKSAVDQVATVIKATHPYEEPAWEVYALEAKPVAGTGSGRIITLDTPITLVELISRMKAHLGVPFLRLAAPVSFAKDSPVIKTVAVCAGSGASVLRGVKADAYVTGEMGHHEALEATSNGIPVLLAEHSNSERGFLKSLAEELSSRIKAHNVPVVVSKLDRDPLVVV